MFLTVGEGYYQNMLKWVAFLCWRSKKRKERKNLMTTSTTKGSLLFSAYLLCSSAAKQLGICPGLVSSPYSHCRVPWSTFPKSPFPFSSSSSFFSDDGCHRSLWVHSWSVEKKRCKRLHTTSLESMERGEEETEEEGVARVSGRPRLSH